MASAAIVLARDEASWLQTHEELVRLAAERAGLDFEEGRWLLRAHREGTHLRMAFGSFHEYTERLFGYSPRLSQEKLRVAEALEELPETARALRTAGINFSVARELTRVATPATEREWLEAARGRTVREVEQLVSGHRPGSLPDDVPDVELKRHVVRLELSATVMATFREAMEKMRKDAGESLDDDGAMLLLCRAALEGPKDPGRASYQVALTVCERCGRATQQGCGESLEVGPEVVAMAACDGQHIGHVGTHVGARGDSSFLDHVAANLVRATQTIPPRIRRVVDCRDGGKCRVPGCQHTRYVDVHHITLRSELGQHHPDNLVTLCSAHHLAIHEGRLLVTGSAELHFAHADGTPYGGAVIPAHADVRTKAFQALRGMGYREGEAKRRLARVPSSITELKQLILLALRELSPQEQRRATD